MRSSLTQPGATMDAAVDALTAYGIAPWMALAAGALVVAAAMLILAQFLARRRTADIASALNDSLRGVLVELAPRRSTTLAVAFDPSPEPFVELEACFVMGYGAAWGALLRQQQRLSFVASMKVAPRAELLWEANVSPGQGLRRERDTQLWVNHRLLFGAGEYAMRGNDTASLEHAFLDLQSRFAPIVDAVAVVAEKTPHVFVSCAAARLNREEIPALVAAVRALGRAALVG